MVRDMNCSFYSYKRSTSLLLLKACVNRHFETPLAQRNCYGAEAEGKFLGLNLVRMRLDIQRDSTDTDECQLRAEGKGSDRDRSTLCQDERPSSSIQCLTDMECVSSCHHASRRDCGVCRCMI